MARKNLIRTNEFPYHVVIRCNNKEWFNLPIAEIWDICIDALKRANFKYPVRIISFVLMNNHYHMILFTPNSDLDKFMKILNSIISKDIRYKTKRINRIFGDRYKWKLINNKQYYNTVLRYIFQNPIHAYMATRCEQYPYSTIYYQTNNISLGIELPSEFTTSIFIDYINTKTPALEKQMLKKSLNQIGQSHS